MIEELREFIKENLKVSVSTDFNDECNGDTITVELLLKNKEGKFEIIDNCTDYLTWNWLSTEKTFIAL